jgi:hypothetical protein
VSERDANDIKVCAIGVLLPAESRLIDLMRRYRDVLCVNNL